MKSILFSLTAGLILTQLANAALPTTLRIGTDASYEPYESLSPEGKIVGFDIDLTEAICQELKMKCQFQNIAWDGLILALNARKIDVISSSMSIKEERRKHVEFTQKLYNVPNRFVAKAGRFNSAEPAALKGIRVGVQKKTIQDEYLTSHYPDATIVRYDDGNQSYLDLKAGRIDAVFADAVNAKYSFLKKGDSKGYDFFGPSFIEPTIFGQGVGLALRKPDTELRDALNRALATIRANGTYKKIQAKYFDFDVYGK